MAGILCVVGVATAAGSACAPNERETLNARQLETPRFTPPPPGPGTAATIDQIAGDFAGPEGTALLLRLVPSQGATLWISVIVLLVVAFDFNRLSHPRNIELLALLPIGFLLFDVMGFFELFHDPVYWRLMDWVFIGIMAVSLFLLGRALVRARQPHAGRLAAEPRSARVDGHRAAADRDEPRGGTASRCGRCRLLYQSRRPAAAGTGHVSRTAIRC